MFKSVKATLLASGLALAATVPAQAQGFEGAYAGVYGGTALTGTTWMAGVQGGYNFALGDQAIAGVEGDVFVTHAGVVFASALGRLGFALSSNMLIYGALGLGAYGAATYYQASGGAEFNVTDNVFLRASVDRFKTFGGGPAEYMGKVGAGYRF